MLLPLSISCFFFLCVCVCKFDWICFSAPTYIPMIYLESTWFNLLIFNGRCGVRGVKLPDLATQRSWWSSPLPTSSLAEALNGELFFVAVVPFFFRHFHDQLREGRLPIHGRKPGDGKTTKNNGFSFFFEGIHLLVDEECPFSSLSFGSTLPETNSQRPFPKGNNRIPNNHFQGRTCC